jgi:hypothetical protein
MTDLHTQPTGPDDMGLLSRFVGVLLSPRSTFEAVVARPRWLGMFLLTAAIMAAAGGWLMSTEIGQQAALDEAVRRMESFGMTVTDSAYAELEKSMLDPPIWRTALTATLGPLIGGGLMSLVIAALLFAVFVAMLGTDARFKQFFAVVVHASPVFAVQQLFVVPLSYARESMASATNLAVFFPMIEEGTFAARLLGSVDLFLVWWTMVLAIGIAVASRRRTTPVAVGFFIVYGVIAVAIAAILAAWSGS